MALGPTVALRAVGCDAYCRGRSARHPRHKWLFLKNHAPPLRPSLRGLVCKNSSRTSGKRKKNAREPTEVPVSRALGFRLSPLVAYLIMLPASPLVTARKVDICKSALSPPSLSLPLSSDCCNPIYPLPQVRNSRTSPRDPLRP